LFKGRAQNNQSLQGIMLHPSASGDQVALSLKSLPSPSNTNKHSLSKQ
jgi:hypothetical protein